MVYRYGISIYTKFFKNYCALALKHTARLKITNVSGRFFIKVC
jgi:hypothetical protein